MKRLLDSLTTVAFGALLVSSWILFGMDPVRSANQDIPRQQLAAHLTPEMLAAPLVRPVPPPTKLTLTIGLVIRNRDELLQAARQVSEPGNPSYRKYLTAEQVADRFGAPPADYQALLDWANSHHFTVTAHKNGFVATVVGSVADIETALNVHMLYRKRPDGTEFFAPDAEPSIELGPKVEHISGLENFVLPQRAGGSGSGGEYQGSDFRNAYAPGITLRGAGQSIGIFMSDGFTQGDIDGYATLIHQSFLPVEEVPANSAAPSTSIEGTLDIEMALSMAPKAQVVVFLGNSSTILANMTDRTDIRQFSSSWFWYNGTTMDEQLMAVLATQGQSFFQASGDDGTLPAGWPNAVKYVSLDCRQFPNITIVGGTSLNMSDNGASYGTLETVWNGSSGGALASVPIPAYQAHIIGHNGASSSQRNVPDVSAQAAGTNLFYWPSTTVRRPSASPIRHYTALPTPAPMAPISTT
jgi:subtilase family serine protease